MLQMIFGFNTIVVGVLTLIVHGVFSVSIYLVAVNREQVRRRRNYFAAPVIWAIATLLGGIPVAAMYWLIHESKLNPETDLENFSDF